MVKSPIWQLARVYIYTLPFANLDMILENASLQGGGMLGVLNFEWKSSKAHEKFIAVNKII